MVTTETVTGPRHPLDIARDDLYRAGINLGPMLDRPDSTPATLGDLVKVAGPLADALGAALAAVRGILRDTAPAQPPVASDATLTGDGVVSWALTIDGDLVLIPDVHPDRSITLTRADVAAIVAAAGGGKEQCPHRVDHPCRHSRGHAGDCEALLPGSDDRLAAWRDVSRRTHAEERTAGALCALDRVLDGADIVKLRDDIATGRVTP